MLTYATYIFLPEKSLVIWHMSLLEFHKRSQQFLKLCSDLSYHSYIAQHVGVNSG